MREAWDRRPSPFAPGPTVSTVHVCVGPGTTGTPHETDHGADCWCEPGVRQCEDGCCRLIVHGVEGSDGH